VREHLVGICALGLAGCGRFGFGGPGDAGNGVADGAPDGAAIDGSAACPDFALHCDGFESGGLGAWPVIRINGPGTASVVSTPVRTGSFALDAAVGAAMVTGGAAAPSFVFAERSTGVLAIRQWINLEVPMERFDLAAQLGNPATGQFVTMGGDNNGIWVSSDQDAGSVLTDHVGTMATPPVGVWTCVELVVTFPAGPTPGRVQVFADDVAVIDATIADPTPAYTRAEIGVIRADRIGFAVGVDDVVIAAQRVTCGA
jgi:hypothetical protein